LSHHFFPLLGPDGLLYIIQNLIYPSSWRSSGKIFLLLVDSLEFIFGGKGVIFIRAHCFASHFHVLHKIRPLHNCHNFFHC